MQLASDVAAYRQGLMPRPPADPLGERQLPRRRAELDLLWDCLCLRLQAAGGDPIAGKRLVADLALMDTRALRLLVAYGRVHHREHRIVGLAGSGYLWGGDDAAIYAGAAEDARRRGRCYMYLYSLFHRQGAAVAIAQLALDAVQAGPGSADDLRALIAADRVSVEDVLAEMIRAVRQQPGGEDALRRVGEAHADVLLPRRVIQDLERHLGQALSLLHSPDPAA